MIQKIFTRDFVLSFVAQFATSSVLFLLLPTIPIYLSRLGSTEAEIGVLVGAFSVSSLLLRPIVGRALVRIPERSFMIGGTILYAVSSAAYFLAPPFWPLLIVRIIHGIGLAFFSTASFTLIANISPDAHRGRSLSYFYLAINIAFALGPSLGVFLMDLFDFTILFLVCTGLSLCSLFITLKLSKIQTTPLENPSSLNSSFLSREALPPAIMAFMGGIIWGAVTTFFPLFALSHGVGNPGFFFTALAITLILARSLGGKILDLYSREKVILPSLVAQILATAILTFSTTLSMFILVAVLWGMGNAFFYPALVTDAIDHAGSSRGAAIGTYSALSDLGIGLGSVIMGIVLELTNYSVMFLCMVLTGFINLSYFRFIAKKRRVHPVRNSSTF
jgi:predicted MFS family arabinose efflux permease